MINEPIIALATAPMKSALALIRLSGDGVINMVESSFSRPIKKDKQLVYGSLLKEGKKIDDVVLLIYRSPNSYTGEDMVEISCHGSMLIVNEIIEHFLSIGFRLASRGEFTSRAFLNGKMDLIQAEAVNDLINATTKEAKALSLSSLSGEVSNIAIPLQKDIADILSLVEVGIDFPEYDEEEKISEKEIKTKCSVIVSQLDKIIVKAKKSVVIRKGLNVAIVGAPNVGKSSLLNALLNENKAIVSSIPGTTRDVVEGDVVINGIDLHLLDTAGIHETKDDIESIGVSKSFDSISKADLILCLSDESGFVAPEIKKNCQGKNTIFVINKKDKLRFIPENGIYISAKEGDIDSLKAAIKNLYGESDETISSPSFSNERELGCLERIRGSLQKAISDIDNGLSIDLISVSLLEAYNESRILLGQEKTLDLTDEIFSRFCVGK